MAKGIDEEVSNAIKVTDYLVSLPSLIKQYLILIVFMGIFGVLLSQTLIYPIMQGILSSFLILVVPTIFSALTLRIIRRVPLKRSFFLMLVMCFFYMLIHQILYY